MSWVATVPLLGKVIDKLFPDADKAREAKAKLAEMMLNGELEELALKLIVYPFFAVLVQCLAHKY